MLDRIYRLKLLFIGALLVMLGLVASIVGDWLKALQSPHLLVAAAQGISDVLVVTGGFGIAIDFFTGRDKDAADAERTRRVLQELTPDFTEAVVRGFAVSPDNLRRVATPELLDALATNALAMRLGDSQFAQEIYTDVRDQAIRAPERWYDVEVNLHLSSAEERSGEATPLFDVVVEWEYTTVPAHSIRRFACVSERDDYDELVTDVPSTSTWFMTPGGGLRASSRESFELVYFSVDGAERLIRRSERKSGQTYGATISDEIVRAGESVRLRHVYRVRARQRGHYLFVEVPQPAKNVSLRVDYSDTEIARLTVMNLVTSARRPEIVEMPAQVDARVLDIDLRGWVLPRAGFTFVWSLVSEFGQLADAPRQPTSPSD